MAKTGVKVRGTCREGHVTDRTSEADRVTWKGECAHDGCTAPVFCRRLPADAAATPKGAKPAETTTKSGPQAEEVGGYAQKRKPRSAPVAGTPDVPGAGDTGGGADGAEQPQDAPGAVDIAPGPSGGAGDVVDPPQRRRDVDGKYRGTGRLRGAVHRSRERSAARREEERGWAVPNILR